jgi:hypothetical protein
VNIKLLHILPLLHQFLLLFHVSTKSSCSNNHKKNGKEIYQQVLQDYRTIITKNKPQVIVTVAQRNSQKEIISFLQENGLLESNDYYLFR